MSSLNGRPKNEVWPSEIKVCSCNGKKKHFPARFPLLCLINPNKQIRIGKKNRLGTYKQRGKGHCLMVSGTYSTERDKLTSLHSTPFFCSFSFSSLGSFLSGGRNQATHTVLPRGCPQSISPSMTGLIPAGAKGGTAFRKVLPVANPRASATFRSLGLRRAVSQPSV